MPDQPDVFSPDGPFISEGLRYLFAKFARRYAVAEAAREAYWGDHRGCAAQATAAAVSHLAAGDLTIADLNRRAAAKRQFEPEHLHMMEWLDVAKDSAPD